MCGIIGIASQRSADRKEWLESTLKILRHRGPDGGATWWDSTGRVGLAHRRLSIIDLSNAADQPMSDSQGGLTIVFNGEIYNFRELREKLAAKGAAFRTQSDTEVILAAYTRWGVECLSRLNGMFAFALHDAREETLLLARDRAGEKPLYYYLRDGTLHFASELKALLADPALPRVVDSEALDCYLGLGYVPGARCILQGYRKLPPANALLFHLRAGIARTWRYWEVPALVPVANAREGPLVDELEALLEDSVRRQLVADVPVGVLLSGGVDSSLITAMAARASDRLTTFTVRFPGHDGYDETEHARLVANHFGTTHRELEAKPATVDLLPVLARQFDEPLADSSLLPTFLVSRLVRQHCTVALGGDGGDELFGGYRHYSRILELEAQARFLPRPLRRAIAAGAGALPIGMRGRNWFQAAGADLRTELPSAVSYFDARSRRGLRPGGAGAAERALKAAVPAEGDVLQKATRRDFTTYLPDDILVKVDRASMANSLEVRAPFLDHRIVEFAYGKVPSRFKATRAGKKILLKRLATRVLPPAFDCTRKQGFSVPLAAWLREESWSRFVSEVLLDPACSFPPSAIRPLLRQQRWGLRNEERLFALVMFELWRRSYGVAMPS